MPDSTNYGSDRNLSRRSIVRLMGAGGLAGLAGCQGNGDGTEGGNGGSDDTEGGGGGDGNGGGDSDVFVEGWDSDPGTLDLHEANRVPEIRILSAVHENLFVYDTDLELQPHLATDWESNDDATEFSFQLRDDVTFHDGTEFNAEVAKWNFDRAIDMSPVAWQFGEVDSVEETGDYEVTFHLAEPWPMLPDYLVGPQKGFTTPDALDEYGDQYGSEGLVGSGPVQFEEWSRDSEIVMSRFEDYDWGPDYLTNQGPSGFEEYRMRIIPEATTLVNELTVGNVNGSPFIAPDDVAEVEDTDGVEVERIDDAHPNYLVFNTESAPTDEVEVRQAVSHAIDREGVITAVHDDEAYPIWSLCPPMADGAMDEETAEEEGYNRDLQQARQLLDDAGWTNDSQGETRSRDGEDLELTFFAFEMPIYANTGEVVQSMLTEVGIGVDLEVLESGTLYDRTEGGEHNLLTMALGSGYKAIDTLTDALHSDNHAEEGGSNYSFYRSDEFDELIDEASVETDTEARNELLLEAQAHVLDEAPVAPILGYRKFYGYDEDIQTGSWFDHPWWPSTDTYYINRLEVSND